MARLGRLTKTIAKRRPLAQVFRRVQKNLDVEAVTHRLRMVREQALDDDYVTRFDELENLERSVTVAVDRFENRLPWPRALGAVP